MKILQGMGLMVVAALLSVACSKSPTAPDATVNLTKPPRNVDFTVYKSPTCGCCSDWIKHLETNGFTAESVEPQDLSAVKQAWKLSPELQSCHTAVSRQGYLFEGHIPAHVIQRFLAERPANAVGLVVPGMPLGSPGMEIDDKFEAYDVLLLRKDGKTELFTRISHP
ncbi:hypothetical protein P886_1507 [Alteromonadaceae bacterium 2753L.S.0a.02]|nr:hypothetical protein P886_1507 [Alteromonadaceae bacterium 2753L.S.0a.02]